MKGPLSVVIGATVADARLHACAGHPAGKAVGVVVAALGSLLEEGHTPKLGAPDHVCILQQAALFEVADERGRGLVWDLRVNVVLLLAVPECMSPFLSLKTEYSKGADTSPPFKNHIKIMRARGFDYWNGLVSVFIKAARIRNAQSTN